MKKIITIICSSDVPVRHLLNTVDYQTYEAVGEDAVFTMVERDKNDTAGK